MNDVDVKTWFEIARYVGAGGAFVLAIMSWKLWTAYQAELSYSKSRDRETLTVLNTLMATLKDERLSDLRREDKLMMAIQELKEIILSHSLTK